MERRFPIKEKADLFPFGLEVMIFYSLMNGMKRFVIEKNTHGSDALLI